MRLCGFFGDANEQIDIPTPAILKPKELWTGKQLMSLMLRPNKDTKVFVNMATGEKNYNKGTGVMGVKDGYVLIKDSQLLAGNLGKKTLGDGTKTGLYYTLIRDHSGVIAADCMLRLSKFTSRWISNYGMTIGISDVTPL